MPSRFVLSFKDSGHRLFLCRTIGRQPRRWFAYSKVGGFYWSHHTRPTTRQVRERFHRWLASPEAQVPARPLYRFLDPATGRILQEAPKPCWAVFSGGVAVKYARTEEAARKWADRQRRFLDAQGGPVYFLEAQAPEN